ncbi:MAG: helix-turn-helix transcriptional regulator [Nocardioidaceae bacterium]|nr:helix-turn-helix transcriptional regulator [Nocardioidaceae bacterium]
MSSTEFGAYLKALRATAGPEDVGLPMTGRRRVAGLRRSEIAQLVGLSTEYYVRLEQGRANPSDSVLKGIARALRLDSAQAAHLRDLAQPASALRPTEAAPLRVGLEAVVDAIGTLPAVLVNRGLFVLAHNHLASRLLTDFDRQAPHERNLARHIFLEPAARTLHVDWERAARDTVGILRLAAQRPPLEDDLVALVRDLRGRSPEFEELWSSHLVHEKTHGAKEFAHPLVGTLELQYETFLVAGQEQHMLVVYAAAPDSEAYAKLQRLAAMDLPAVRSVTA